MINLLNIVNLYIVANIIVVGITLYFAAQMAKESRKATIILAPMVMGLIFVMTITIQEIKSMPVMGEPEVVFEMLSYSTDGDDIYLWGIPEDRDYPRTWVFPYSDEDARKLQEMADMQKNGIKVHGKKVKAIEDEAGGFRIVPGPKKRKHNIRTETKDSALPK